ncbi:MarR family winged helix-turn-helix transcriptional regulator [Nonomuraea sp. NPDC050022]|uniref:MarR family winged helix-turn-helix transcriptional regulator n=1 Tax=unclassified Nonomuraea TaxID=2593643 RepID=UPI0033E6FEC7
MDAPSPWLTENQQNVWRTWLTLNTRLQAALHRELQTDAGLSLQDYDVLVQLTDTADGRMRVSDLARALHWERSRLSHHVTRMARRGLVEREECADDGRGAFIVLTPAGRTAIEQAAPAHVDTVRKLVFDSLSDEELDTLAAITDKILAQLQRDSTS